jgi:hypothetical protein
MTTSTIHRTTSANAEAEEVEKRFRKIAARTDTRIGSRCLCVPKT